MQNNEQTLKDILKGFVKTRPIRDKYVLTKIKKIWQANLGSTITSYTSDIRFNKGTLTIVVTSSPLRQELQFGKEKLMNLLNDSLGEPLIKQILIF